MTRLGSLCTGYGGLDLAAEAVLGPLEHAWHAEVDAHASKVLAHHWPTTPNLGDLTAVDWAAVPPVDVLTAGFPCQPVSSAGRREGVDDDRWLWDAVAAAVGRMVTRPRLLLLENVRGLLSANGGHAMARVVHGLAALGYVGRYGVFSAAHVGAPHRRERVFIAAWPADCPPDAQQLAGRVGVGAAGTDGVTLLPTPNAAAVGSRMDTQLSGDGRERPNKLGWAIGSLFPTPAAARSGRQKSASHGAAIRPSLDSITHLLPTPNAAQGRGTGTPSRETAHRRMYVENRRFLDDAIALLPTPTVQHEARNATANRTAVKPTTNANGWTLSDVAYADRWGDYGAAIQRWELATGWHAPEPTEPGNRGQQRLAPAFVEWLMGLPAGWVTDHLPRNPALKCLGNGVVWQQAAHAYAELLGAS